MLIGAASLLSGFNAGAQTLDVYLSPPGEQNTTRSGAIVETFSGAAGAIGATGSFAIGAWTGATGGVNRTAADQYGGADGTGNYLAIGNGNQVTITLIGDRKYVGFWWSAGNAGNTIEFYDDTNTLLAQFTTNSLTTLLGGGGNITAIDGNSYAKADYFGNPNPPAGRNTGEPYGYINLLLRGASVNFRTIVVRHAGGGGFELDNLAVTDAATVPGTWVDVGTVTVTLPPGAIGAVDDTATTPFNTPVPGNVATNDTTVAGSTFAVVATPANGSVVLDPSTGAYTYTPQPGFSGQDTFTYQQCKPAPDQATCVPATVTVTVGPNAVDDNAGPATQGVPFNASVTGNDSAPVGSTYAVLASTANGTLNLNSATGAYTYTPNAGFSGTDTFTYRVCLPAPNAALCDDATVQISVVAQVPPRGPVRVRCGRADHWATRHRQLHLHGRQCRRAGCIHLPLGAQPQQQRGGRNECRHNDGVYPGGRRCGQLPVFLCDASGRYRGHAGPGSVFAGKPDRVCITHSYAVPVGDDHFVDTDGLFHHGLCTPSPLMHNQ
ncbi:Ig-like domain-containing protein [Acidovorax facilis]|nr:Ig-like domain-containing protein [Acidovorax facilis]